MDELVVERNSVVDRQNLEQAVNLLLQRANDLFTCTPVPANPASTVVKTVTPVAVLVPSVTDDDFELL